jgi:predicted phosphodiesterase
MEYPKFIMSSDPHLRPDTPEARLDDYLESQKKIIELLRHYVEDLGYIALCSGDVTHRARERKEPVTFVNFLLENLPLMYGVEGNHDELYHSSDHLRHTTLGSLVFANKYKRIEHEVFGNVHVYGYGYGKKIQHVGRGNAQDFVNIAVYHGMVLQERNPFFDGLIAEDILKEFPEYDIILTGDNHKTFVVSLDNRVLINAGSWKRDSVDQIDHKPVMFTFDSFTRKIDIVPIPTDNDIISTEHIEKEKARNERLETLSDTFKEVRNITLDYENNLYNFYEENKTEQDVQRKIETWMH